MLLTGVAFGERDRTQTGIEVEFGLCARLAVGQTGKLFGVSEQKLDLETPLVRTVDGQRIQVEVCTKEHRGYPLKAGQLEYDCRYSTMHGMPVTGGRGFRSLKPLWYKGVPP